MTKPDEHYPVNLFPALQWALDLYFKKHPKFRDPPIVEVIFPAGSHKVLMKTIGEHEIVFWMSKRKLYVKARCLADSECKFNVSRDLLTIGTRSRLLIGTRLTPANSSE